MGRSTGFSHGSIVLFKSFSHCCSISKVFPFFNEGWIQQITNKHYIVQYILIFREAASDTREKHTSLGRDHSFSGFRYWIVIINALSATSYCRISKFITNFWSFHQQIIGGGGCSPPSPPLVFSPHQVRVHYAWIIMGWLLHQSHIKALQRKPLKKIGLHHLLV